MFKICNFSITWNFGKNHFLPIQTTKAHCASYASPKALDTRVNQVQIQTVWIQSLPICPPGHPTMSGPFKRRSSLKALPPIAFSDIRRSSTRRHSSIALPGRVNQPQEIPWDVLDRCILPVICCHGAAFTLSNVLNALQISQVTTFTLFTFITIFVLGLVFFYHNLKVSRHWQYQLSLV